MREGESEQESFPGNRERLPFASLHVRLFAIVGLALLAPLGAILFGSARERRLASMNVESEALALARLAATQAERSVSNALQLLKALAELAEVRSGQKDSCQKILAEIRIASPDVLNLGVVSLDGVVIASALPQTSPTDVSDRHWFRSVLETRKPSVGEYQIGRITGRATVNLGHPIFAAGGGTLAGVVYAALDVAWLGEIAKRKDIAEGTVILLVDRNGTLLAREPESPGWIGRSFADSPLLRTMLAAQNESTARIEGLDGVERLFAVVREIGIPGSGLRLGVGIPPDAAFDEVERVSRRSLAVLAIAGTLAFGVSYFFANAFLVRPVRALLRATRALAEGDALARTGLPRSSGEIGQLARAFDAMAEKLADRTAELESEHALLARRVDERTFDLVRANESLARADRMKDEFLASMSHELRTPLNSILGLAESLDEGVYGLLSDPQRRATRTIEESGRHLLSLINDVLDLSKIGAGKLELAMGPVAVRDVAEASLRFVRQEATRKRIDVSCRIDPGIRSVDADERRLKQILVNLLGNAVKFTPEGGAVRLEIAPDAAAREALFTVADTGPGISKEDAELLFQPFVQLDAGLARRHAGTGLGLSLVRRLAALHGGRVALESEPGHGARFTVALPWSGAEKGIASAAAAEADDARAPRRRRALIVEGDAVAAAEMAGHLVDLGFSTESCATAVQATERFAEGRPDVVFVAATPAGGSGWDALSRLKSDPATRDVAVILVSPAVDRRTALDLGAAETIESPASRADLARVLERVEYGKAGTRPGRPPRPAAASPLVLVADDNEANVATLADFLRAKGYRIAVARDGREAVERTAAERPDAVLMDVQMPELDGLEATRRIRQNAATAATPIVVLTALAMPGDRELCLRAGADEYVTKPVSLVELIRIVEAVRRKKSIPAEAEVGPSAAPGRAAAGTAPPVTT